MSAFQPKNPQQVCEDILLGMVFKTPVAVATESIYST